jgi:ArsR family transcriptional regulator, arsenate/arsenite/antimonite-responsive transcriptional repressor
MRPALHQVFKALADPTRIRLLNILLQTPCCVCEMETVLRLPQPLISRHLAYLRNAGLVRDQRQGMRVQYSADLNDGLGRLLQRFLQDAVTYDQACQEDLARLDPALPAQRESAESSLVASMKG